MFDRETLKRNRRQTIIDIAKGKRIDYREDEINYQRVITKLQTEPFDMHFDFSHRTAIHDCLDFKSLEMASDYREMLIKHVYDCYFESKLHS